MSETSDWKNEKAILLQKLQIQEKFIQESKEREENLRRMNEAFINSIQNPSNSDNAVQRISKSIEQEQILQQKEIIDELRIEQKLICNKLQDKESQLKLITKNNEKEIQKLQQRIIDLETAKYEEDKENNTEFENKIKDIQNQLANQKQKYTQEIEKLQGQLRKTRVTNYSSQQKKDNEEILKLKEENKKLKQQIKILETQTQKQQQDYQEKEQIHQQLLQTHSICQKTQEQLKNQLVQLHAQLEEERVNQQRQRNQSPSHPTTRIRTNQQQNTFESTNTNTNTNNNSQNPIMETEVSSFLCRLPRGQNNRLEGQIKDIQEKLYHAKRKITRTTEEENSFIRQSIQKIKNRSRNHSISVNDTAIMNDENKQYINNRCDESLEFRTQQSIYHGFKFN